MNDSRNANGNLKDRVSASSFAEWWTTAFRYPLTSPAVARALGQELLYRRDRRLRPYFSSLSNSIYVERFPTVKNYTFDKGRPLPPLYLANRLARLFRVRKSIKCDRLFVYEMKRGPLQASALGELIVGHCSNGQDHVVLDCTGDIEGRAWIQEDFPNVRVYYAHQLVSRLNRRMIGLGSRVLGSWLRKEINALLTHGGINDPDLTAGSVTGIMRSMIYAYAIAPSLQFRHCQVQNHWRTFGSALASIPELRERVSAIQHGIITHSVEFPIEVRSIKTFSETASQVMLEGHRRFVTSVRASLPDPICASRMNAFDFINTGGPDFQKKTILFLDQHNSWSERFFNISHSRDLAKKAAGATGKGIIRNTTFLGRPHPSADKDEIAEWEALARGSESVRLSRRGATLVSDISQSSIVLGMFSGALVSAAYAGFPIVIISHPDRFYPLELRPLEQRLAVDSYEDLVTLLDKLCNDYEFYKERIALTRAAYLAFRTGTDGNSQDAEVKSYETC